MKFKIGDKVITRPPLERCKGVIIKIYKGSMWPIRCTLSNKKNEFAFKSNELRKLNA